VNPSCNQACDGQIQISATGGTSPYSYSNDGAVFQNNGVFNNLCAGVYPMTIRDAQSCLRTVNVTLNDPAPLSVTVTMTQAVSCNAGSNGRAVAVAFGGTNPYTYQWSPSGQLTAIATGLTAGSQSVIVTDANGCTVQGSVSITQPNALAATIVNQINPSCFGANNGRITIQANANSGVGPYSYNIGNGNQPSGNFVNLSAGVYTITVTDNNGCFIIQPVILTEPNVLEAGVLSVSSNYNGTSISCFGACDASLSLGNPTGGTSPYNYTWSNSNTTQNISGLCAGFYRVTVTDARGCTDTTSISITQPATLNATITVNNAACTGTSTGEITINANGGNVPYLYTLNGVSQSSNIFSNIPAGTYNVIISDANGCSITRSAVINSIPPMVVNTFATTNYNGFNVRCFGSTDGSAVVSVASGLAPYTYLWSNGQNTQIATGLAGGTPTTVTVTDNNGCTQVDTIILTEPTDLTINVIDTSNLSCGSASTGSITVSASGGLGSYTYSINNNLFQSNPVFNNLTATTHTIVVRDLNGCRDSITQVLQAPAPLIANVTGTNVSCFGFNDGTATINATGGVTFGGGSYLYNWSPGGQTNQSIGNLAGNVTYTVTVQDANGCLSFGSIFISRPTQLIANIIDVNHVSCNNLNDGNFSINITGASGSYYYSIDGGQNFNLATTNPVLVSGLSGGTYQIVVRDSISASCEVPVSVEILENGGLQAPYNSTNVACFGYTNGTSTVQPLGGAAPFQYNWSNGQTTQTATGLTANFIDSVFVNLPYSVTVTDANGCTAVNNAIAVGSPDSIQLRDSILSQVSCYGGNNGSLEIYVAGGNTSIGYSVLWNTGATTNRLTGLDAFVYEAVVTDIRGCRDTIEIEITEPAQALFARFETDSVSCYGLSDGRILLDTVYGGTAPYEYSYAINGPFTTDSLFNAELPIGIYEITVRDTNGCIFTVDSIRIAQPANIIVYAFQDQTINLGDLASVYANTNVLQIDSSLVSWYYYRNDSIVNVCTGANCFNIDVANLFENTELIFNLNNGCGDSASVNITVNQRESIFVPNAFTPNGDGQNDVITVFGSTDVQIVNKFMVFDRWGELLFESSDFTPNDLSNGWDGKFKGEFLNPGVFVYYAEFTLVNGRKSTRKGDITIIR